MTKSDRFHGVLIVDKPAGWTSHDVVGRIRRVLGQRSVGHAGTLDPAATGVLPVAVGSALRSVEFLTGATKSYRASITFGTSTDSLDLDGVIDERCDPPSIDLSGLRETLRSFIGASNQVPPAHSAIRVAGVRSHQRVRRGERFDLPARPIWVDSIDVVRWDPPELVVDIDCSKGFYVRSFARDLGRRFGSCAHLSNLVRTRVGSFSLCDAWTLAQLEAAPLDTEWERIAIAPDMPAATLPAVILDPGLVPDWERGKRWPIDAAPNSGSVRVYDSAGRWLGIGEIDATHHPPELRPRKVIPTTMQDFWE